MKELTSILKELWATVKGNKIIFLVIVVALSATYYIWIQSPLRGEMNYTQRQDAIQNLGANYERLDTATINRYKEYYNITDEEILAYTNKGVWEQLIENSHDKSTPLIKKRMPTPNMDILLNVEPILKTILVLGIAYYILAQFLTKNDLIKGYKGIREWIHEKGI